MYNNKGQIRLQNKQNYQKQRFYMMRKGQFYKKDITILNIYAPNKKKIIELWKQANPQLY